MITWTAIDLQVGSPVVPESPEHCLREAEECDRLAGLSKTAATRQILQSVAFHWRKLAERVTERRGARTSLPAERTVTGVQVLVVEDEPMIRILLEDMLAELGYTVAAEATRIEEALEATKNAEFDLAILDANLNGQPVSPVADALVARGTPFVFATGYGEPLEPHRDRPTLKKPFQMDGLKQLLQSALATGNREPGSTLGNAPRVTPDS
jgi:CheY-like chemotaxis protein